MNNKVKIAIVEDNSLYAENLSLILNEQPRFNCDNTFATVNHILKYLENNIPPDLILLDIGLPGMDGITAIKLIKDICADIKIVMLTIYDDDEKIFNSAKAGANGFLLKGDSNEKIINAISEVIDGGAALNAGVAARILHYFEKLNCKNEICITDIESNVLRLFTDGKTKKEIAAILFRSVHTVDSHIRSIYRKLHVNNRASAVSKAIEKGLL